MLYYYNVSCRLNCFTLQWFNIYNYIIVICHQLKHLLKNAVRIVYISFHSWISNVLKYKLYCLVIWSQCSFRGYDMIRLIYGNILILLSYGWLWERSVKELNIYSMSIKASRISNKMSYVFSTSLKVTPLISKLRTRQVIG